LNYIDEIEQYLPKELLAVSHTSPPEIRELAWYVNDFKKVLLCLYGEKRIILGGDVYKKQGDKLEATWDYWDYHIQSGLSQQENIDKSYKEAIEYIEAFSNKFGDDFLYSVVIETNN
jgi:hypothetical protein